MDHLSGLVFRRPQATLTADLWSIFAPPFSRAPAYCAAVPPAAARLRHKPAVAHDVEAGLSKVVTPRLAARPLVDRIHRPSVTARRINSDRHKHQNAFFRYKSIIGAGLRACSPGGRGTEVVLACNILNQMTGLGRPMSYRIGR